MNWEQADGDSKQYTGTIKEIWCELTEDDLTEIAQKHARLADVLQNRYGYAKPQAEEFAKALNSLARPT